MKTRLPLFTYMRGMVGPGGSVVCVDVQPKMLDALRRRAAKAELADRIHTRVSEPLKSVPLSARLPALP